MSARGLGAAIRGAFVTFLPVGLALGVAACEYPGVPHPLAATLAGPQGGGPVAGALAAGTPATSAAPAEASGPVTGTAEIRLRDFQLVPDRVTVKAGTITFVLRNEGRYSHDFRVEGQGVDQRSQRLGPGRTFEWQIALAPGTYHISCPISNHNERGMDGELTVVE